MRILIVDDEADIRDTTSLLLEHLGHQTQTAATGAHAITLARTWRPELILMDLNMPIMDGVAAISAIRGLSRMDRVHIAVVSAYVHDPAWCDRVLRAGANECIVKPVELGALEALLARVKPPA